MKLQVKKIIALSVTAVFCLSALYSLYVDRISFTDIMPIVAMVIGYYFGRGHGEELNR
jgi:hypothetical protein